MIGFSRCVVLLRHGHSEWNLGNRFTGWSDIALTDVGLGEARAAGRRLLDEGYSFDEVHVSVLCRTRETADEVLAVAGSALPPTRASWRLNERHYGQLQGMNKEQIFATWGRECAWRWWRGYHDRPPALDESDPRHPRFDPLYASLAKDELPAAESLADCQQRVLPYWRQELAPRIAAAERLLVVTHGNTMRSLVMHVEGLDAAAIESVEIPSGIPLVYEFDPSMRLIGKRWLQ